jgi:hypothetical protein
MGPFLFLSLFLRDYNFGDIRLHRNSSLPATTSDSYCTSTLSDLSQ